MNGIKKGELLSQSCRTEAERSRARWASRGREAVEMIREKFRVHPCVVCSQGVDEDNAHNAMYDGRD